MWPVPGKNPAFRERGKKRRERERTQQAAPYPHTPRHRPGRLAFQAVMRVKPQDARRVVAHRALPRINGSCARAGSRPLQLPGRDRDPRRVIREIAASSSAQAASNNTIPHGHGAAPAAAAAAAAPELPLRAAAQRASVREDRDVLAGLLRGGRRRRGRGLRVHARRRDAARRHQVQHPDRPGQVQEHLVGVRRGDEGAGPPRLLQGMGAHIPGVQRAGRVQVRPLRALQEEVLGPRRPGVRRQVQDPHLPRRLGHRRGVRRRRALPHGGRQGQGADAARVRQGAPRRLPQDRQVRGVRRRAVQRTCSSLGATDSLHHDEVRDIREHRGDDLQAPHPHAEGPVQQTAPARSQLRERLRRRSLLRRRLAPRRQLGLLPEQRQGSHRRRRCQEPRPRGPFHARPSSSHSDGRYPDCSPVDDL